MGAAQRRRNVGNRSYPFKTAEVKIELLVGLTLTNDSFFKLFEKLILFFPIGTKPFAKIIGEVTKVAKKAF
jgi:hypothetical protein